jgi:hypothetical protein
MDNRLCVTFLIWTMSMLPAQELKVRAGTPSGPPAAQREAGDAVTLEPASGDLIVTSRGQTLRFPASNRVEPQWACNVSMMAAAFTYECTMANGPGALQRIPAFSIECPHPERVSILTPGAWKSIKGPVRGEFTLTFVNFVNEHPSPNVLSGGRKTGAFRFTSDLMPGLVKVEVVPSEPSLSPNDKTEGEKLESVSPWVQERILALDARERRMRYLTAIGPKIAPESDSVDRVRVELASAAFIGIFPWKPGLSAAVRSSSPGELSSLVGALSGGSDMAMVFRQSILWRLERLAGAR